jgi:signal transduction histidine kinase/DNA-binding response OmpR family regulator/ABC-type xylose transport system substrate-binding protein
MNHVFLTSQSFSNILSHGILLLLLPYLLFFSSCNSTKKEKEYTIGFSQCLDIGNDNWRKMMLEEMKPELSFHNNIRFVYKEANGNSQKQISQIDSLLQQHIDLLIVSPNEAKALTAVVQKVYDAGIPVVVVDRRIESQKYTAFVGASNYEVGQTAGRYAVSLLKGSGRIIEIAGLQNASPFIDRHNGFMDIISKNPGIKYIKKVHYNTIDYLQNLDSTVAQHKDADLIFAQSDYLAREGYNAAKKANTQNKIKIIGIDGLPTPGGGMDMVKNNLITATVLYPTGGQEAIQTAINILQGKPYQKENRLLITVIDSANVRVMQLQNDKMIAQQKDIDRRQQMIEQQQAISRNQSVIIYTVSISLALTLILGLLSFFSLQENKKINARLALQNEEILNQRNQLIELNKKAQEASEAKINFFTNISHEFRTPLTLILAPLDEMKNNAKLDHTSRQYVSLIQKNTIRLLKLINELMDFRKIESDKMQLRATEQDIVQFVDDIIGSFKTLAKKRNIDLRLIAKQRSLPLWFDDSMLDKVIFNLLSNAFKFTGDNGLIYVTVDKNEKNNTAVIIIEDNGIGMPPEVAEHAFDLFYQGKTTGQLGSGLGLSLSKELIQLHRGNITVQSTSGTGTIFTITLPLGTAHLNTDEISNEKPAELKMNYDERIFARTAEETENGTQTSAKETASDNTVLIIEDNNELRNYLVQKLCSKYQILEADNGTTAIQFAFENVPDLIISDVALPGKDGFAITNILKTDVRTSHIPIILLTAKSDIQHQIEGMKSMADAYIVKPFNYQFLEETIKSVMKNREILREHYTSELPVKLRTAAPQKLDKKFINDFAATVESNISNDTFSVDDICTALGISRVQLYRKVKALLGISVNDYILDARLQKARYLLQNEDLTIAEVAYQVGFSSQAYFATVFKNKLSITPSEFKEKARG